MKVVASNPRGVLRSTMFTKIKRKLIEAVRLIVTRRIESDRVLKLIFRAEDVGVGEWIPLSVCHHNTSERFYSGISIGHIWQSLPTTTMFRMPSAEQPGLMCNAVELLTTDMNTDARIFLGVHVPLFV
jgi:hypothetical protein